ncbi:MAG: cob(I)yrinic acid a,c-diamide adenosyltransferase [Longimicrobiales bacterium]|nr:cob(I)yrinic acid a,c-diamide adenosyltransferase [Longimicrobiales bacterium]
MKIYTRRGDQGETGLFGGGRIPKSHPRIEATGAVDELNAALGRALTVVEEPRIRERLRVIQDDLFTLGSRIASRPRSDSGDHPNLPPMPEGRPEEMEGWIDEVSEELEPLEHFILPGGSAGAAELHVARTVCRRAERRVVALAEEGADGSEPENEASEAAEARVDPDILRYLNRLSDLLFAFGRLENRFHGRDDVLWHGPRDRRG